MTKNYQFNFSEISESIESMYDSKKRIFKAKKTIKIFKDYLKERTLTYYLINIKAKNFYFMIPTYIWLLKKPMTLKPS